MPDAMIAKIIYYNIFLSCTDAAIICCLLRRTAWRYLSLSLLSFFVVGGYFADHFSTRGFNIFAFVACVLFIHAPILLFAAAFVFRRKASKTSLIILLASLLLVAVGVDAFFIEPHWLEVSRVTISSPKIERPLRIVFIADLQTDAITPYEEDVLQRALAEKPDIILFGGDYLQVGRDRWNDLRREANQLLKKCELKAPHGVFAVQGNIDSWNPWPLIFTGLPVVVVRSTTSFDVAGIRLTCLSKADSFNTHFRLENIANKEAAEGGEFAEGDESTAPFHLVLGHAPDYALGRVSADLLLAGHTHGGQVRLPGLGPIMTLSRVPRNWASGVTELPGGGKLIVSRGIGMERHGSPRVRFLCRPELAVIDLVPEEEE